MAFQTGGKESPINKVWAGGDTQDIPDIQKHAS